MTFGLEYIPTETKHSSRTHAKPVFQLEKDPMIILPILMLIPSNNFSSSQTLIATHGSTSWAAQQQFSNKLGGYPNIIGTQFMRSSCN
jgi:hypothetical protein